MESLHKYIPKDILPPEYEGDNASYCSLDFAEKEMFPFCEKYEEMHQLGFR